MLTTRLALVEGLPGSGKSTTAQFIARGLGQNLLVLKMSGFTRGVGRDAPKPLRGVAMEDLKAYRQLALKELERLLADKPRLPLDEGLDDLIRAHKGLPARPAGALPYERLFTLSTAEVTKVSVTTVEVTKVEVTTVEVTTVEVISAAQLDAIASGRGIHAARLNEAFGRFFIDTPLRMAHFLANMLAESGLDPTREENMNYSAERLVQVWPSRFTPETARLYARQPEKLANFVYANRIGNGDEASGDGWRYRGRGLIQLTGRGNYRTYGQLLGAPLEDRPELAASPEWAFAIACQFWQTKGINRLADADDANGVRIAINGGLHGIEHVRKHLEVAKRVLAGL